MGKAVHISSLPSKMMDIVLKFIYNGVVNKEMLNDELLDAATQYEVTTLVNIFLADLKSVMNSDNCIDLLLACNERRVKLYKEHIICFIQDNWEQVKASQNFEKIRKYPDVLLEIFWNFPNIKRCNEKELVSQ